MSVRNIAQGAFDISTDGRTVWVNDAGSLVGRFGRMGIDVHRSLIGQTESGRECLYCTHGVTTPADWQTFRAKMAEHYGAEVPHDLIPTRLR